MPEQIGQHEISDNCGSTVVYGGAGISIANITTSISNIPSAAANAISGVVISTFATGASRLLVSFDGGTSFKTIRKNTLFSLNIKGEITQLVVKTSVGTIVSADVEFVINFED